MSKCRLLPGQSSISALIPVVLMPQQQPGQVFLERGSNGQKISTPILSPDTLTYSSQECAECS